MFVVFNFLNVQGLTNNFNLVEILIDNLQSDFVVLTETNITEILINGYNLLQIKSNLSRTGGVIIYSKKQYKMKKIM